jgi:hypothetical protein
VAQILDRYIGGEGYEPFQKAFSVLRDAYTHEAGVHLFRRESNLTRARGQEKGRAEHYNIAFRENQILEKYYPTVLQNSKHWWTPEIRSEVISKASQNSGYESRVSAGLITNVTERQVLLGFSLVTVVCMVLGAYLKREKK